MTIRIVIADDHSVVRQGLRMFLALDGELDVVGEATNGAEAVRLAQELRPDVVLMDLLMPVLDGVAATEAIRRDIGETEVLALTSVLEDQMVIRAMRAGAIGYLLKDTEAHDLCRAIKAAAAGKVQMSPSVAARLVRQVIPAQIKEPLTARETDVLRELSLGKSNKEIASTLFVAEKTVRTHVSSILAKLGLNSRTQAALHAIRIGLVPLETPE